MKARKLQVEHLTNPIGIDFAQPSFSWVCEGGKRQTAYQLVAESGGAVVWDTGKTPGNLTQGISWDSPPLKSRSRVSWRVRLWDETGTPGEWSAPAVFELGLLSPDDWKAKWIDPELEKNPSGRQPASYLKKSFRLAETGAGRLYVTAHGLYDVWLNGQHVDGYFLAPGNCQVEKRLQVQTYDVSGLLRKGENQILVTLGDGWYRGSFGYGMQTNTFGEDVALLLQLEVNGESVAVTDESWQASQSGPLGLNDMMKGEEIDARKWPISDWHSVRVESYGYENLIGTDTLPVTAHESFAARLITTPAGETVLDFGQMVAGYTSFCLNAHAGNRIVLTHGETLDENGNFTIANFQNPWNPQCFQRVDYLCQEGENRYHPTKCYFGFRYVKVETDLPLTGREFTAHAVYSDMERTAWFTCGDPLVNRLFENSVWSMKGNFVDVPTDCPTREKFGYSGDCQVFAHTAMYLMDCYPVLRRWLAEQAATQFDDGCVRQTAPDNSPRMDKDGGAGWCDSLEIVPWRMAMRYGDLSAAEENYETIRKWMMFALGRGKTTQPENRDIPENLRDYFIDCIGHWGEWLEPGQGSEYFEEMNTHGFPEVATAYLSFGCRVMSDLAKRLGYREDEQFFREAAKQAKAAYRFRYLENGNVKDSSHQCRYVRPLALELLEEDEEEQAAATLAKKIKENGGCLNTGFLTTHELCRVLTDHGQSETAYDLLLQRKQPSWLFAVEHGATAIPESWDCFDKDGKPHDSFNHYSYGAISGWLIDRVCGIVAEDGKIVIRPYPDRRLGYARAVYDSPLGKIFSGWRYEGEQLLLEVEIPTNATAKIVLPDGTEKRVHAGTHRFSVHA